MKDSFGHERPVSSQGCTERIPSVQGFKPKPEDMGSRKGWMQHREVIRVLMGEEDIGPCAAGLGLTRPD